MVAKIIDGKAIAAKIRNTIRDQITALKKRGGCAPKLAVIVIGEDPASLIYVQNKHKACQEVGIESVNYSFPARLSQKKLVALIEQLNNDSSVHGILVQLPLPPTLKVNEILDKIDPLKDVDGFHPINVGFLVQRRALLHPCTPHGVILMLAHIKQKLAGKHAVIVGASNIVGRPMALELLAAGCTVTLCHRMTKNLAKHVEQADILVSAVGKPAIIKGKWIKKGAVVIDVGITKLKSGKVVGDVEFNKAQTKAQWITPVPGGVGPMTVAALLKNTLEAQKLQKKLT